MPDLDLEDLKRLLARREKLIKRAATSREHVGDEILCTTGELVNTLPDLIARVERAEKERDRFREELRHACAALIGAASAYRAHAGRSGHIRPRSRPDPFFLTRVLDMDKAAEQARSALTGDTPNV